MSRTTTGRLGLGLSYSPPPVTPPPAFVELSPAPDGIRTWFGDPIQLREGDYVYIGYVDTSGNVALKIRDLVAGVTGPEIILKAALDVDDHVNPSFLLRPDGKLQAFYARHEPLSTTMHTRVSVSTLAVDPLLEDGFAAEASLDAQLGARSYDYPVPIYLSDEGLIHLFWRSIPSGNNYDLWHSTSADGDTWTTGEIVAHNGTKTHRQYWKIASNFVDRIDFAITDGSPNTDTTHLAHFYYDGAYRGSDGTSLGVKPAGGFAFSAFTPVHTSSNSWVYDIWYVAGAPVIVYATYPVQFSQHRYHYGAWDGASWDTNVIVDDAGGGIDSTGVYSGGITLDKIDAQIVYAAQGVDGQFEIHQHTTGDGGATWAEAAKTEDSAARNIRPSGVWNGDARLRVVWAYGAYTGYTSFNTGLRGAPPP